MRLNEYFGGWALTRYAGIKLIVPWTFASNMQGNIKVKITRSYGDFENELNDINRYVAQICGVVIDEKGTARAYIS